MAACKKPEPREEVDPVNAEQAAEAGRQFLAAAQPCVESKLVDLIDHEALAARTKAHSGKGGALLVRRIIDDKLATHLVCEWQRKASAYNLLRVHTVDGQPRPVLRRVVKSERNGVQMVAYDELVLGVSRKDHRVRIIDIYSYVTGQTLSELLGDSVTATAASLKSDSDMGGALDIINGIEKAKQLKDAGKFAEALATLDSLPPALRRSRAAQLMRVATANGLSQEAYKQALDEIASIFPDDAAIALVRIDADILRGDYEAALHDVDVVDHAIGGDPWQDAIRSGILAKRNGPGDLERAAQAAERAVKGMPEMSKGYFARLDVEIVAKQTKEALATMTELSQRFGAVWDDARLRATPVFADLVATPEYEAWRLEQL